MRRADPAELPRLAELWHFSLDDRELAEFHSPTEWLADALDELDRLPDVGPEVLPADSDPGLPRPEGSRSA